MANYTHVPTPAQVKCLIREGYTLNIVGASYGNLAHLQLRMSAQYGMKIEAYAWITHPFTHAPIDRALGAIDGLPVQRLWLDAEADTNGRPPMQVVADIDAAIAYAKARRPDLPIGIYTANWWWGPNTGGSTKFKDYPLWLANYVPNPNPAAVPLFGGWTKAALWQYAGTVETCGLNTDRNLILEQETAPPPVEEDEDMKPILVWNTGLKQVWLMGPFGAVPVQFPADAAQLENLYGKHAAALSNELLQSIAQSA
jgi:hypothetical protein